MNEHNEQKESNPKKINFPVSEIPAKVTICYMIDTVRIL